MKHLIVRILVAFLTLITGLAGAGLFIGYYYPDYRLVGTDRKSDQQPSVVVEFNKESKPETSSQSITFTDTGIVTSLEHHYKSSDGKSLRMFCLEHKSVAEAVEMLHKEITDKHIVERTSKLDKNGKTIGERIVFTDTAPTEGETKIVWTEGTRYYRLRAPSIKYALLFEQSLIWNDDYCL